MARGGDSNENVLPWSNGSVHAILASSCMDVAASSSESTRPNRRNTVLILSWIVVQRDMNAIYRMIAQRYARATFIQPQLADIKQGAVQAQSRY